MRKRGLSSIVVILLMVLLILMAISAIWIFIYSLIYDYSENAELNYEILTLDLEISNITQTSNMLSFDVKKTQGDRAIDGLVVILSDISKSDEFEVEIALSDFNIKRVDVDLESSFLGDIVGIKVYPVLIGTSGKKIIGSIKAEKVKIENSYGNKVWVDGTEGSGGSGSGGGSGSTGSEGDGGRDETEGGKVDEPVYLENGECFDEKDNDDNGNVDFLDFGCFGPNGQETDTNYGWTLFDETKATKIVYVSSTDGNDDTGNGSLEKPYLTITKGLDMIEDYSSDWLLLKRGDVWRNEGLGYFSKNGKTEENGILIGSYGVEIKRPLLELEKQKGIEVIGFNVSVVGIEFYAYAQDPNNPEFLSGSTKGPQQGGHGIGTDIKISGDNVLLEDNVLNYADLKLQNYYTYNHTTKGQDLVNEWGNIKLRRNIVHHSYSIDSHAQGIFSYGAGDLLLEENVYYHNGWNDDFRLELKFPQKNIQKWNTISDGRFSIQLEGEQYNLEDVDFSSVVSMAEVAQVLENSINGKLGTKSVDLSWTGLSIILKTDDFDSDDKYKILEYGGTKSGTAIHGPEFLNFSKQGVPESTVFNRNMYLSKGYGNTILRGNIDAKGASGGVQQRMGGLAEHNLFLQNPRSIVFGHFDNPEGSVTSGILRYNVVLGAMDIANQVQGSGIGVTGSDNPARSGIDYVGNVEVYKNIIAHQSHGTSNIKGLFFTFNSGTKNIDVHDNIVYNWSKVNLESPSDTRAAALSVSVGSNVENIKIRNNHFQQPSHGYAGSTSNGENLRNVEFFNNTYYSGSKDNLAWSSGMFAIGKRATEEDWFTASGEVDYKIEEISYSDPSRNIETYMDSLGLSGGVDEFMGEAMKQSKYYYREEFTSYAVNDYIREGFQVI